MLNGIGIYIYVLTCARFSTAFGPIRPVKFSPTLLDASLRSIEGDDEINIPADGTVDLGSGCTVVDIKGKYYCTAKEDGTTYISDSSLTAGVNYVLSNGMKIRTASNKEFEVLMDDMPQSDPMMKMMFESMRAGFPSDDDSKET
mmetsp:Transcript_18228/g.27607  ORF Transcript_18228/g.27607 Transcript_18228/m.27607 type:complete len:144 (-) Transcript_18228:373-804(-)